LYQDFAGWRAEVGLPSPTLKAFDAELLNAGYLIDGSEVIGLSPRTNFLAGEHSEPEREDNH
jgi:hypothetical protein